MTMHKLVMARKTMMPEIIEKVILLLPVFMKILKSSFLDSSILSFTASSSTKLPSSL
jgi:hypothetical protein